MTRRKLKQKNTRKINKVKEFKRLVGLLRDAQSGGGINDFIIIIYEFIMKLIGISTQRERNEMEKILTQDLHWLNVDYGEEKDPENIYFDIDKFNSIKEYGNFSEMYRKRHQYIDFLIKNNQRDKHIEVINQFRKFIKKHHPEYNYWNATNVEEGIH